MAIPLKEIDFIGQYRVSNTVCDELIELYKKVPETKEDSPIFKGPGKIGQTSYPFIREISCFEYP